MTTALTPKPLAIRDIDTSWRPRAALGSIAALADSIADTGGLYNPVVVDQDRRLLLGFRRLAAYELLGRKTIFAITVASVAEAAACMVAEGGDLHQVELTLVEKIRLGLALELVDAPAETERRRTARRANGFTPPQRGGAGRRAVAAALGVSETNYHRARLVVTKAMDATLPRAEAVAVAEALMLLEETGNILGAYTLVKGTKGPEMVQEKQLPPPIAGAAAQRTALVNGIAALGGLCDGFERLPRLDFLFNAKEAGQWTADLRRARRTLDGLTRVLKESSNV